LIDSPDRPVALVTGAASGIGAATARRLSDAGYRVALNYRSHASAAESIAASINGRAYHADVAAPEAVTAMVEAIEAELGPIELAVCNAGIYTERLLADLDDSLWERTLRVNLGGCYHVARAVAPRMRERGGTIVTIASEMAFVGGSASAHYVTAKAAILGFTRALARELAPTVRVNAVAPGPVDTPLLPERDKEAGNTRSLPLRRVGTPDEIADVVVALAASTWTTGAVWSINGGAVIE
jgi:NAD(P)-dependent dehydrogenase (short-subunit alcohol dehydrogenase family)